MDVELVEREFLGPESSIAVRTESLLMRTEAKDTWKIDRALYDEVCQCWSHDVAPRSEGRVVG